MALLVYAIPSTVYAGLVDAVLVLPRLVKPLMLPPPAILSIVARYTRKDVAVVSRSSSDPRSVFGPG